MGSSALPDYEVWHKVEEFDRVKPGDEVDICVMPRYAPRYDSKTTFQWMYQVAYRRPGSSWPTYQLPNECWISPWDFGLIDASTNNPNWDQVTSREHHEGKGKWLYQPACDDPELCPGGDWSRYECSNCGKFVKPFSNDQGDLLCPWCEVTGLVLMDDEQLDRLEEVARWPPRWAYSASGCQLCHLDGCYAGKGNQCCLSYDFAPHSFAFAMFRPGPGDARKFIYNGGLIYQGPSCPADGSSRP